MGKLGEPIGEPCQSFGLLGMEAGEVEGSSLCDSDLSKLWRMQIQHILSQHPMSRGDVRNHMISALVAFLVRWMMDREEMDGAVSADSEVG